MKILFDLQPLQTHASAHRGVGRYTFGLINAYLKLIDNSSIDVIFLLSNAFPLNIEEIINRFEVKIEKEQFKILQIKNDISNNSIETRNFIHAYEILREVFIQKYQPDIIVNTNLQEGRSESAITSVKKIDTDAFYITTLHDVVPFYYQDKYIADAEAKSWYFDKIENAINSDLLLTVSHSSKNDILKFTKINENNVKVVENGVDEKIFNADKIDKTLITNALKQYGVKNNYILYWGGTDLHKNLNKLLISYSKLSSSLRKKYSLLLIGREISKDQEIKKLISDLNINENVIRLGFVSDEDLIPIIKGSSCFVFPALHEGFGLPPLEAMACGIPVIGSNTSAIAEVINTPEALFDPYDSNSIKRKIEETLTNEKFRKHLIDKGAERVKYYSWENSAKKLMDVINGLSLDIKHNEFSALEKIVQEIKRNNIELSSDELLKFSEDVALNFPLVKPIKKKIYLDISAVAIQDDKSGIQRVTRSIANVAVRERLDEYDIELIYGNVGDPNFYVANNFKKINGIANISLKDQMVEFYSGDILIFLDFHPNLAIYHQKTIQRLRNANIRVYHILHDILPIQLPEYFWGDLCSNFREWLSVVVKSDGILCVSKTVTNDLKKYCEDVNFKLTHNLKLGYFHNGSNIDDSLPTKGIDLQKLESFKNLKGTINFLMVGTIEPRKGYIQILDTFNNLWAKNININLIMVGRLGWGMNNFEKIINNNPLLGKNLLWLQGISDEFLDYVYSESDCLIAASEGEGFGLPLIEAAKHNLPIFARDIDVFREVAQDGAYFFKNSNSIDVVSKEIEYWISLYEQNKNPISNEVKHQTWSESFKQIIDVVTNDNWLDEVVYNGSLNKRVLLDVEYSVISSEIEWAGDYKITEEKLFLNNNKLNLKFSSVDRSENVLLVLKHTTGNFVKLISILDNNISLNLDFEGNMPIYNVSFNRLYPLNKVLFNRHTLQNFYYEGFSSIEREFVWSVGNLSKIYFNVENISEINKISFFVKTNGLQQINVKLNNNEIIQTLVEDENLEINLPLKELKLGLNFIEFDLPLAHVPDKNDERLLGIAFKGVEVTPVRYMQIGHKNLFDSGLISYEGFSTFEDDFIWTNSKNAEISFFLESDMNVNLELCFKTNEVQDILIEVNDSNYTESYNDLYGNEYILNISNIALKKGRNKLKFTLPKASAPTDSDKRELAIALRYILIGLV